VLLRRSPGMGVFISRSSYWQPAILELMSKRTILLLFGGESAEHEVSIRSAANVYEALNKDSYDITLCYIDRSGRWWLARDVEEVENPMVALTPVLGLRAFIDGHGQQITPDLILPMLHGPNGEDGSVQGLAQLLHIPIVGCGITGSAVCMDKDVAKRLLRQAGIGVVESVTYRAGDGKLAYKSVRNKLGDTVFVKPANMGSSVGVSKVTNEAEFDKALEVALQHDRKVLIEQAIVGRELECSVLGNAHPEASVVGEVVPQDEFYSYDAKYAADTQTETTTHADLPKAVEDRIRAIAVQAYRALECRGLARVDFFLAEKGDIYVNEVNTLPGFTDISMYPQLWEASGLKYSELLDRLVDLALE